MLSRLVVIQFRQRGTRLALAVLCVLAGFRLSPQLCERRAAAATANGYRVQLQEAFDRCCNRLVSRRRTVFYTLGIKGEPAVEKGWRNWRGRNNSKDGSATVRGHYRPSRLWEHFRALADLPGNSSYRPDCVLFMHAVRADDRRPVLVVISLANLQMSRALLSVWMIRAASPWVRPGYRCIHGIMCLRLPKSPMPLDHPVISLYSQFREMDAVLANHGGMFTLGYRSGGHEVLMNLSLDESRQPFPKLIWFWYQRHHGHALRSMLAFRQNRYMPVVTVGRGPISDAPSLPTALRREWQVHTEAVFNYSPKKANFLVYTTSDCSDYSARKGWFTWRNHLTCYAHRPSGAPNGVARQLPAWSHWCSWEAIDTDARPGLVLFLHGLAIRNPNGGGRIRRLVAVTVAKIAPGKIRLNVRIMDPWAGRYGIRFGEVPQDASGLRDIVFNIPYRGDWSAKIFEGRMLRGSGCDFIIPLDIGGAEWSIRGNASVGPSYSVKSINGPTVQLSLVRGGVVRQTRLAKSFNRFLMYRGGTDALLHAENERFFPAGDRHASGFGRRAF